MKIGTIQKDKLTLEQDFSIPIKELMDYNNDWFKNYINLALINHQTQQRYSTQVLIPCQRCLLFVYLINMY